MKLTNDLRLTIARSIMSKVDFSEFDKLRELVRSQAQNAAITLFSANKEEAERVRALVGTRWLHVETVCLMVDVSSAYGLNVMIAIPSVGWRAASDALVTHFKEEITRLYAFAKEMQDMRQRVETALASCTSTAQVLQRYPEWESFLPKDAAKVQYALADNTLITDLMKAGFPDGKRKSAAANVTHAQATDAVVKQVSSTAT